MGLKDRVRGEGMKLGFKAVSKIMESPDRAERVMKAVGRANDARESMESAASRLLNLGQLPSREDFKALSKQAGRLKRQTRKINAKLDDLEAALFES